jgi:hypothetical protein
MHSLAVSRTKQEALVRFADLLKFPIGDPTAGLDHIIVMGGATGPGESWPLGWSGAKEFMTPEQIEQVMLAYKRIVNDLPDDLKKAYPNVFARTERTN